MPFTAVCPRCSAEDRVEDAMNGQRVECSVCLHRYVAAAKEVRKPAKVKAEPPPAPPPRQPEPPPLDDAAAVKVVAPARRPKGARQRQPGGKLSLCHLALALGCASLSFAALAGLSIVPMILSAIGLTVAATSLVLGERSGLRTACTGVGTFACAVALVVAGLKFGGPKAVPPSPEEIAARQSVTFPDGRKLARTPRTDDWLDANKNAVEVNGLYVGVAAVSRGRVEFRLNDKPQPSPESQCLIVHVRVIPAERIPKEVRFTPWSGGATQGGEPATLTDAGGNKVSLVTTPAGATVAKHPRHTEFFPEMYIEDVLVFPAPEAEGDLKLTIPAEALGGVGPIRFVIPGGRILAKQ